MICNEGQQHPSNWRQYHFEFNIILFPSCIFQRRVIMAPINFDEFYKKKKGGVWNTMYLQNIFCRKLIQAKKKKHLSDKLVFAHWF